MPSKACTACGETKPLTAFHLHRSSRDGRRNVCGPCRTQENIERLYGITAEDYEALYDAQGGCCASCSDPDPRGKRRFLHVDHCHATGLVRGLLCLHCNVALGKLRDDPGRIQALLDYISP